MGGWGKAPRSIFVVLVPFLGVLVYLIAHGDDMAKRQISDAQAAEAATQAYVRQVANSGTSTAEELSSLGRPAHQGRPQRCRVRAAEGEVAREVARPGVLRSLRRRTANL